MENTNSTSKINANKADGSSILPGIFLCVAVTLLAEGLQWVEVKCTGRAWLESLVLAIIIGTCIRSIWTPSKVWSVGIKFSAKTLLEIAVVLLGANVSARMISEAGGDLLLGILAVVVISILVSYLLGRAFGLPSKMAILIACGNSICGNSAIAAVAPVIDAHSDDVAGSIAFTAVLGVLVVLGLPVIATSFHLDPGAFGVFAGLTVYAVPQVLAATAPIGAVATQMGTLVKLVRVLMLGPVVLILSLMAGRSKLTMGDIGNFAASPRRTSLHLGDLVPWFIVGFILMIIIRSAGVIPEPLVELFGRISTLLTVVSMAALGLGVDVRQLARAGLRVTAVVTLSLLALGSIAWILIQLLGIRAG